MASGMLEKLKSSILAPALALDMDARLESVRALVRGDGGASVTGAAHRWGTYPIRI